LRRKRSEGFLRQDIDFEQGRTVLEEAYEAFVDIKIVEKKLEEINHLLVTVRTMKVMSIAKL
jgi:hypothetical protein